MIQQAKVGTAARVFCVAAVLGLSLALVDSAALRGVLMLAAIAATAIAADLSSRLPDAAILYVDIVCRDSFDLCAGSCNRSGLDAGD